MGALARGRAAASQKISLGLPLKPFTISTWFCLWLSGFTAGFIFALWLLLF
jgi:hypothetical protein